METRPLPSSGKDTEQSGSLWHKCAACNEFVFRSELERNFYICAYCGSLFSLAVEKRCQHLLDNLDNLDSLDSLDSRDVAFKPDDAVALAGTLAGYPISLFVAKPGAIPTQAHLEILLAATHTAVKEQVPLITVVSARCTTDTSPNQIGFAETAYVTAEMERLVAVPLPHITVLTETDAVPLTTHFPVGELVLAERAQEKKNGSTLKPALHAPEEQHLETQTSDNCSVADICVDRYVTRTELPNVLGKLLKFFR